MGLFRCCPRHSRVCGSTHRIGGRSIPLARIHRCDAVLALEQRVRGMGARRFGPDSNKWGRWRSAVVVRGANGGPWRWRWARSAGQHAVGDHPGAGWRELAGTFGCPVVGQSPTVPSGWEWNGSQPGQGAAELGFPRPAPGKMQSEAARERVSRPARAKNRRRRVLVVTTCSPRPSRAVPPARNASVSSMQSPPASTEATSVIILSPGLARPGASPRSRRCCTNWEKPRCRAGVVAW